MHNLDRTLFETTDGEDAGWAEVGDSYAEIYDSETGLDEGEEMELASEALGLQDEAELEYFLGRLVSRVAKKAGRALGSPIGRSLVGILKNAARKTLPLATGALGTALGGPLGAAVGGQLAQHAGSMLGLELEGLSPQDQEYESAKQFVRFAGAAAKNALNQITSGGSPTSAAAQAVATAARTFAPGLLRQAGHAVQGATGLTSGQWVRRGNTIVIIGV
jgi:hypothetical protein